MKEQSHCTTMPIDSAMENGQIVSIFVDYSHPLLQLKRALPWESIKEVMVKKWREAGKNVDGGPGCSWDTVLYVPLLVLKLIMQYNSRKMEAYLSENVIARTFVSREKDIMPQVRDHSNIARAEAALGKDGMKEINKLVIMEAEKFGFVDPKILSADTTAQELPIGYPNEPGILKGIAERCVRALRRLQKKGTEGVDTGIEKAKTVIKLVKEHHLFTKKKETEKKKDLLSRIIEETWDLIEESQKVVDTVGETRDLVKVAAVNKLNSMKDVTATLIPQIIHWMTTGFVAKGKLIHAGITQARAIVRNKTGKKVEFGLQYLINRIGGGYLFSNLLLQAPNETKMPLLALAGYQEIFGENAAPELFVYDRAGHSKKTAKALSSAGVEKIGIQPKGKAKWLVSEEVQQEVISQRGKTEGCIGTLKSKKYGFNKPLERKSDTVKMAGQRSILSFNLNKFMRDLVNAK